MKNTEQIAETVLKRRDAEQEKRLLRHRRIKRAAAGASSMLVFCAVLFAVRNLNASQGKMPMIDTDPAIHTETPSSVSDTETSGRETTDKDSVFPEQPTLPDHTQQTIETNPPPQQTTSNNETLSPSQQPADHSSISPQETESPAKSDIPENPMGVWTSISVSYDEAKERFSPSLVACTDNSFMGYKAGIVSRNGNIGSEGAFCQSIMYEFTNGTVGIIDQDRMAGSRATYGTKQYDYLDRTFEDETFLNDEQITIGYYPEGEYGFAYVAVFDRSEDIYNIMDRIISVEIRNRGDE